MSSEFLIVGLGASAGGIRACKEFFTHVPADSGIAYVVILHLAPNHESHLSEVLQSSASVPIIAVRDRLQVEPNHIYVISPNLSLTIADGSLIVSEITRIEERRAPIDIFFRTLADAHESQAVCVVLSGTGADGSMGLKRIKERGGICLVQDPEEAEHPEMPRNAIATDLVDQVLPVAEIPARIFAYRDHVGRIRVPDDVTDHAEVDERALREIFTRVRTRTGHDFSNYKRATVLRRIERRIAVQQLADLPSYSRFLQEKPEEARALLKDLLISVTHFFRDTDAFSALQRIVLPQILANKSEDQPVRVWVPGCATGEEAYSLAMLLTEEATKIPGTPAIQLFATDIDEAAIAVARDGLYTLNDAADVSPERLRRFFSKEGDRYRVRKEIRETVLFAHHNLIKDPPFSRLDLVSCRNVLIYLNKTAQNRLLEVLHFAVNPNGYLLLGSSESVDGSSDLFANVDKAAHIFQRRPVPARLPAQIAAIATRHPKPPLGEPRWSDARVRERPSFEDLHLRLLEQYAPPSVVVNEEHEIVHLSERAGRYLQFSGGEPSQNLLKTVRPEIRLELRTALFQAAQSKTIVEARGLPVRINEVDVVLDVLIKPVLRPDDPARGFFLVVFEERVEGEVAPAQPASVSAAEPMRQLEEEVMRLRAHLRTTVEQHETQAEELKASNEELQAINEELRSATEELETSKEELQSVNEELSTVNQELKVKIEEQSQANNDVLNLVNATDIGIVFLDRAGRVKLFTPPARELFALIQSDRGRPLSDISSFLDHRDFQTDIDRVLDTLERVERELQTRNGRWHLVRLAPYRTTDQRIDGVVITFVDITERRAAEEQLRHADRRKNEFLATLAHELRNPLAPLRTALDILSLPDLSATTAEQARLMMRRQLVQLVRLVDDLLDISRITLDKVHLRRERIVLAECVATAVETNQPLIDRAGQQLSVTQPTEPLFLDADPVRISQAISNLLNNASKYTSRNGRITLTVSREAGSATISVSDEGRGINAEVLPRVFDLFMQAADDAPSQSGGLGLGLTLVRALVELHGGTVEARSEGIGKGSEFVIRLPLAAGPAAVQADTLIPPNFSRHRIIVVDDNPDTSNSVGLLLNMLGADVRVLYDGVSALSLLDAFRATVVILDIGMPVMDGYEVARQIRARSDSKDITLVAISGWGQDQDRKRALEVFDYHLTKPVGMGALQEVLKKAEAI